MRSTRNRSEALPDYVLTRPAQRSPKSHRVPIAGTATRAATPAAAPAIGQDPGFFCLNVVAAYGVILDFEASAIVIGAIRRFVEPRELEVIAALLFAEGAPVTVDRILRICRFTSSPFTLDQVNRLFRKLRPVTAALGAIEAINGGFRLLGAETGAPPGPAPA